MQFLDATAKFTVVGFSEVVSACCRGVARDLYLTKDPLQQKVPLTVQQVRKLELSMQTVGSVFRCVLGQIPCCVHACCRWEDAQHLKSIPTESGHGETLLYADALISKTVVTTEPRTGSLLYAAIGSGILMVDWAHLWLEARDVEGLACTGCVLPSCSEKQACWLETPMNASEATAWSRVFLEGTFQARASGLHSCKTTLLTWAGRCVKVSFSPAGRRLLGHHLDPSMKSFLCHSRESFTTLYSKVLRMFRLIRSGKYCPDMLAIERVVQCADGVGEERLAMDEKVVEEAVISDSDSSVASSVSAAGDQTDDQLVTERCVSLFPSFPGVPEANLFVHNLSGLVHVVNEGDIMLFGRPTSSNFRPYAKVTESDPLASCRQRLRPRSK